MRPPRAGNKFWPLPPDYDQLNMVDARRARIQAVSDVTTPADAAISWNLFCDFYLRPDDTGFDPGFYKPPIYTTAPGHLNFVKWMHQFDALALEAPRGWAKSTIKRSVILWKLLTQPRIEINSFLAKDDFVLEEAFRMKMQLEQNERILEDFGEQKPDRGAGLWTGHTLTLRNQALYRIVPVAGKKRGLRGTCFLDDVEYDEGGPRSADILEELKYDIIKVIIPMLDAGNKIIIMGTFLGKRAFLYHVIQTDEDPRFRAVQEGGDWLKVVLPAVDADGRNAWAAKYTPDFLEQKRRQLGEAIFQTEYMGNPQSEDQILFRLNTVEHDYEIEGEPPEYPLASPAVLTYRGAGDQDMKAPAGEHFRSMQRFITVDPASSQKLGADYSAVVVAGICPKNTLWVLDCWQSRVIPVQLARQVWEMAKIWRPSLIAVESFSAYLEVYRQISEYIRAWSVGEAEHWVPSVLECRPPATYSKEDRIASLAWRVDQGRLKLPAHLRFRSPHVRELYQQLTNFTMDGKGLAHDDLADALALVHFVARSSHEQAPIPASPIDPLSRVLAGEWFYPGTKIPLLSSVDYRTLPPEVLEEVLQIGRERIQASRLEGPEFPEEPEGGLTVRLGGPVY